MVVQLPPLIVAERISILKKAKSQKSIYDELTKLLFKSQSEVSKNEIFDALIAREKLGSTCIGDGISIPRAHLDITNPRVAIVILKKGLKLNSVDKKLVKVFFCIIFPRTNDQQKNNPEYKEFITELHLQLIKEKHIESFMMMTNPEILANYFEALLEKILSKTYFKQEEC